MKTLTADSFSPYLNQTFHIHVPEISEPMATELVEVTSLGSPAPTADRQQFSIILRHQGDHILPQRIYQVSHEKMGTLDLFLVPVGSDQAGIRYEAVFA